MKHPNPPMLCAVYDRRSGRRGVFNGLSRCKQYALVKYPGTKAVIVPLVEVRRIYKWQT